MEELENKRKGYWFKAGYSLFDEYTKYIGTTPAYIYLFLRSYINKDTKLSFPSEKFIAVTLNIHRTTVIKAIKVLIAHRLIIAQKIKSRGGQWAHNVYSFTSPSTWLTSPITETSETTHDANITLPCSKNNQNHVVKSNTKKIKLKEINKKEVLLKEPEEKVVSIRDYVPDFLKGRINHEPAETSSDERK